LASELAPPAEQPPAIVEPGYVIHLTLGPKDVDHGLGLQVEPELEKNSLSVEGLAEELPSASTVGVEPLLSAGRSGRSNEHGRGRAKQRVRPQSATHLDPVQVRHLRVQDDCIRSIGYRSLDRLTAGVCL